MKINYIVNITLPNTKAHTFQICKMCESFAFNEVGVNLIVPRSAKENESLDIFNYYKVKNNFNIIKINSLDVSGVFKYFPKLKFYFKKILLLFRLFFYKLDKGELVYTRDQEIAWLFKLKGYKVAYECHSFSGRKRFLLKNIDYFVSTSENTKNIMRDNNIYNKDILVAPNGVDLSVFGIEMSKEEARDKVGIEKDKKVLVYAGGFRSKGVEKGINNILHVLNNLDKDVIFYAIGGSDQEMADCGKIVSELNIGDRVHMLPRQDRDTLAIYQKAADVLLMPFPRKAHFEFFMTPIKMFEYMASKRPIVASDLPSIKAVLSEESAFFCEPGSSGDLAKRIEIVLGDDILSKQLAENAFEEVKKYTWLLRAKKIINFIK